MSAVCIVRDTKRGSLSNGCTAGRGKGGERPKPEQRKDELSEDVPNLGALNTGGYSVVVLIVEI